MVVLKQVARDADVASDSPAERVVTSVRTNVAVATVTFQNEVSENFKFTSNRGVERGSLFGLLQNPEVFQLQCSAQGSLEGDENEQIKQDQLAQYHRSSLPLLARITAVGPLPVESSTLWRQLPTCRSPCIPCCSCRKQQPSHGKEGVDLEATIALMV